MTLSKFPNELPAITLDFQNSRQLDPRISFSRASGGGTPPVIGEGGGKAGGGFTVFPENVPRLTDKGLLIEEAGTTYSKYNTTGADAGWADGTESTEVVPPTGDPTVSVRKFTASVEAIKTNPTDTVSMRWFSVFVKPGNWRRFGFRRTASGSQYVWFDLSGPTPLVFTGDDKNVPADPETYFLEQYTNDWWRMGFKWVGGWGTRRVYMFDYDADGKPIKNGATPGGNPAGTYSYAWGHQCEVSDFCSSWIPNVGNAAVTRAADVCEITGTDFSSWFSGTVTMVISAETLGPIDAQARVLQFMPSTNTNPSKFRRTTDAEWGWARSSAPGFECNVEGVTSTSVKIAAQADFGDTFVGVNGETNTGGSSQDNTSDAESLDFSGFGKYLKSFAYYPTPLTDDELEAFTK